MERLAQLAQENLPWIYGLVLSLWGGLVQYAARVRAGEKWQWGNLVLDLLACSFSGLIAFMACQEMSLSGWKMAIVVSVSAHEGTRALALWLRLRESILRSGGR
ncbi:MAG: phage holin family protein [Rhodocyclaceae bacterium]|nr:phage holin family protein [Rhodocyclaceae bacterium]